MLQKAIAAQVLEIRRLSEADGRLVVVICMTRYADKSILRLREIEAVSDTANAATIPAYFALSVQSLHVS